MCVCARARLNSVFQLHLNASHLARLGFYFVFFKALKLPKFSIKMIMVP